MSPQGGNTFFDEYSSQMCPGKHLCFLEPLNVDKLKMNLDRLRHYVHKVHLR